MHLVHKSIVFTKFGECNFVSYIWIVNIEEAFLEFVKTYSNKKVASAWRTKVSNGVVKTKTMRKYLQNAGWTKVNDEQWQKN